MWNLVNLAVHLFTAAQIALAPTIPPKPPEPAVTEPAPMISPENWASVPFGNRNAFRDFAGQHYLWHRALVDQIFRVTGTAVPSYPIGDGGGAEWLLAVQRQYEAECRALGLAAPPDLSSYDLSNPEDFASWTFLLSQQAQILAVAAGLP